MGKGRCQTCKKEVEIKDEQEIVVKEGKKSYRGVCPVCGTKVFRRKEFVWINPDIIKPGS